jgi:(p)ppGpp synthase/HD superfamily hydrolase
MQDEFGDLVVSIVKNVSENKRADDEQTKPWRERKEYYLHHLRILEDIPALIASAADKIHNISSMLEDYSALGNELWLRFNAPKADQLWNYQSILDVLKDKDIPQGMKEQLEELVDKLEAICSNE